MDPFMYYSNIGSKLPAVRIAPMTTGAASRIPWAIAIPCPT